MSPPVPQGSQSYLTATDPTNLAWLPRDSREGGLGWRSTPCLRPAAPAAQNALGQVTGGKFPTSASDLSRLLQRAPCSPIRPPAARLGSTGRHGPAPSRGRPSRAARREPGCFQQHPQPCHDSKFRNLAHSFFHRATCSGTPQTPHSLRSCPNTMCATLVPPPVANRAHRCYKRQKGRRNTAALTLNWKCVLKTFGRRYTASEHERQ